MEELWGSPDFVAEQFQNWYRRNSATIPAPIDIAKREFAFITFHSKSMHRHIFLPTEPELQRYLQNNTPMHAYHSSSYYIDPTADMSQKGWLGADLVFDIDADHFDLPCQKVHDKWRCRNCDEEGTGSPPEMCKCGKAQFITETWLCEKCLQAAKYETQKLLDILITDFGAKIEDLITNFSGNRGYHVHVHSNTFKPLDQNARREIVDYIMAIGLEADYQGFSRRNRGAKSTFADVGWRGRTGRAIYDYLSTTSEKEIRALKLSRNATNNILNRGDDILNTLVTKHPSNILPLIDPKSLEKLLAKAKKLQASEIDTVVTTDIHRLIRLPNTLHGKTGWQVQTIPYSQLSNYDPLTKSVIIKGPEVKLEFRKAPKIKILDTWYGPYEEEVAELPLGAALFFLCKKGAKVRR
ncbi:DNA primase small subunit domain-containing protein [Thermoproteota archaeon]